MKTFEERYRKQLEGRVHRDQLVTITADELRAMEFPPTSEARLASLPPLAWSPDDFRTAGCQLAAEASLRVAVESGHGGAYELTPEVEFKYATDCIDPPSEDPPSKGIVALVREGDRIIGYGSAAQRDSDKAEITIIDVDRSSRRDAGLQTKILAGGEIFGVGVWDTSSSLRFWTT